MVDFYESVDQDVTLKSIYRHSLHTLYMNNTNQLFSCTTVSEISHFEFHIMMIVKITFLK